MAKIWKDENGIEIPANRVTSSEKLRERTATSLLKDAKQINQKLTDYKITLAEKAQQVYEAVMAENNIDISQRKGNFTFYNFDRSIKVEVNNQGRIDFDDTLIEAAKEKLMSFIDENVNATGEMIKALVLDAFSTSRGKLDVKKVTGLIQYRQRIPANKYPKFHEAIDLIEKAIRRPDSKFYFRIYEKDSNGEFKSVELNFSNVSIPEKSEEKV